MRKKCKVHISSWDRELFQYLHEQRIALVDQIDRDLPKYSSRSSLTWRLWKLSNLGYLTGHYSINHRGKSIIGITKKTFDQYVSTGQETRKELKSDSPVHDLSLVDVRHELQKSEKVIQYFTENKINTWPDYYEMNEIRPYVDLQTDAVIQVSFPNGRYWIGIEYESSLKARDRYKHLFQKYYAEKDIIAVFYICSNKSLVNYLMEEEAKIGAAQRKFYYKTLSELKQDRSLVFTSGRGAVLKLGKKNC